MLRLIVLIPHRDYAKLLEAYKKGLFSAGIIRACSFPMLAPLATVSRAFKKEELKDLACALRKLSAKHGREGKITAKKLGVLTYPPENLSLIGLELDLQAPDLTHEALIQRFPSLLLCAGLVSQGDLPRLQEKQASAPLPPPSFFRAAMIANMVLRQLDAGAAGYSFEWKIGEPVWLPKQ
jgi:hypothetical protein